MVQPSREDLTAAMIAGTSTMISHIEVQWPDGTTTTMSNVAANQTITISSLAPCEGNLDDDDDVDFNDLVALLAAWGPCGECAADLDDDGSVGFPDLILLLAAWGPCD